MKQVFDQEQYKRIAGVFETALSPAATTPMYASDPNSPDYLLIQKVMREFNLEKYSTPQPSIE